jgi:hypothetical protein
LKNRSRDSRFGRSLHDPSPFRTLEYRVANHCIVIELATLVEACDADDPAACGEVSRVSRFVLWGSALIWSSGFFVAYLLADSGTDGSLEKISGAAALV